MPDATTAPLRTTPLPVRVDTGAGQIVLYVGGREAASAWGPALDDPDTWFFWNGNIAPYRISGGREGAAALIECLREEAQRHEGSLWHPDHGEPDRSGYVAVGPAGAACLGCGNDLGGCAYVEVLTALRRDDTSRHYVCASRHYVCASRHYVCDGCSSFFEADDE